MADQSSYTAYFPDFAPADMPFIPDEFEDTSCHQDACPTFRLARAGLTVQVDYLDPAKREFPDGPRFCIFESDDDGGRIDGGFEYESDDWAAIMRQFSDRLDLVIKGWTRKDTGGGLRPWTRLISDNRTIFLGDAEGGNLGASDEPCSFSVWRGDDEIDSDTAPNLAEALRMIDALDANDPGKKTLPDPDELADRFVVKLAGYLTSAQWTQMLALNDLALERGGSPVCHSHDFCDANVFMDEAWRDCLDAPDLELQNDAHMNVINAAWSIAQHRFLTARAGTLHVTAQRLLDETQDWEDALKPERPSLAAKRAALRMRLAAGV